MIMACINSEKVYERMKQYEYKIADLDIDVQQVTFDSGVFTNLNDLGAQGWEVTQVLSGIRTFPDLNGDRPVVRILLKKETER